MDPTDLSLKLDGITDQLRVVTSLLDQLLSKVVRIEATLTTLDQAGRPPAR
jgi:hypothetical protein